MLGGFEDRKEAVGEVAGIRAGKDWLLLIGDLSGAPAGVQASDDSGWDHSGGCRRVEK